MSLHALRTSAPFAPPPSSGPGPRDVLRGATGAALMGLALSAALPAAASLEVLPQQRSTAEQVAQQGVPLSALADNAPDSHTVKPGDTLWALSAMFLKSPWRWPELWGMNLPQIRNPHLIYPGQVLVLIKDGERARLQIAGTPAGAAAPAPAAPATAPPEPAPLKWNAGIRSTPADDASGRAIPLAEVAPFLTQTALLSATELGAAARVVGGAEGRTLLWRGDLALVHGAVPQGPLHLYRDVQVLRDPQTGEVLGHEARFVGTAEAEKPQSPRPSPQSPQSGEPGPIGRDAADARVYRIRSAVLEVLPGDLLVAARAGSPDVGAFMPRAPARALQGQVVAIQRDALSAGQRQVVTLNRGERDGLERGHILTLWKSTPAAISSSSASLAARGPFEPIGQLMVVGVSERVAHALVLEVRDAVRPGDRFAAP